MKKLIMSMAVLSMLATSCVSKKKMTQAQARITELEAARDKAVADCEKLTADLRTQLGSKDTDLAAKNGQLADLQTQIDYLKRTNTNLLDRLSDLSVVSKSGAESIKKSLETLNEQSRQLTNLNQSIQRKDSLNLALVMNLKRSLQDINDQDVQVEVKKGVVYVSIADKLLFQTAKYEVNKAAETVLGKVAQVVNDHKELDILVQGHTDVYPIQTEYMKDNWDLSVLRATSVARLLQTKFKVAPERLTAAGRGEYEPKSDNTTPDGRRINRRTEIILTPKLDQFFNLLTTGQGR
ncbi:OmpA/MotB family protein [Tellurirhabdus rosea]|uniref:OmpA/MotB family protein n=1 Tax=Tellurirhabdus rosea TaxID=2674997 RepID=UPI00225092F0|nr:OmpA family protein [Tellurirhabdus rosea]